MAPRTNLPDVSPKIASGETEGDVRFSRRQAIKVGGATVAAVATVSAAAHYTAPRTPVFVARNQRYDGPLRTTIADGLQANDIKPSHLRGRRVLLKPNLVEPTRVCPHMITHPAVIVAAAELFRDWGATVTVGEAPGHVRDTEMALSESGVGEALADAGFAFADLNYEEVGWRPNESRVSPLDGLFFPRTVLEADLVVSMPKMKTHHWVGITAGMKNLFGVLPGIKYGWPKNVLHHNGIPETVVDINASLPQTMTIVDGIVCMEGDGPILGSAKHMGLIVVGANVPAADATIARIMGLNPARIPYLKLANHRLGPIADGRLEQRGERWQSVADPFKILDRPHLRNLRLSRHGPLVT